ncbi:lipopolysaccharide biosynthesis protein [Gordoniibacillus kamchatkensis]|uniref:lipopolysaccharide biosynthesis protein n=1 Tax=Gordoniibacillus kamchatkensis TaxID=1590651 RepID=UPI0009E1E83C|nr:oligosaccharide flippase family protein [Paenibacillus sp. VKM B-2647]
MHRGIEAVIKRVIVNKNKEFLGVFSSNVFNNVSSLITTTIAAVTFGPKEFGNFGIGVSVTLVTSMLLDFGLNTSLIRFYNAEINESKEKLITTILSIKVLILFFVSLSSFFISEGITLIYPVIKGAKSFILAGLLSGGLLNIWSTIRSIEQAKSDFTNYRRYTFYYGWARLLISTVLYLMGNFSLIHLFISLYIGPLILVFVIWTMSQKDLRRIVHFNKDLFQLHIFRKVLTYGYPIAISVICYSLLSRLPQFVLMKSSSPLEVGIYSAALSYITVFILFNDTLRTILLPSVVSLNSQQERSNYRKRLIKTTPVFFCVWYCCFGYNDSCTIYCTWQAIFKHHTCIFYFRCKLYFYCVFWII